MVQQINILVRPASEWKTRNDVAIHLLEPTVDYLVGAIEDAEKHMFNWIVLYTDKPFDGMSNIFNGSSTWNRLRNRLGADLVRCGEVGDNYGHSFVSRGQGFTVYLE